MELSIMLAKLCGIFFLSVGIYAVSGQMNIKKMLKSFDESPGLTLMSGFTMIVLGGLMIQYHNIWVKDWPVLVTIIGWATMIKGITFIIFPQMISGIGNKFMKAPVQPLGFVIIAIGLVFGYFGFLA